LGRVVVLGLAVLPMLAVHINVLCYALSDLFFITYLFTLGARGSVVSEVLR
jgi:hypothetical protein